MTISRKVFPDFHTKAFDTDEERLAASLLPVADRQEMVTFLLFPYPAFQAATEFVSRIHMPVAGGSHGRGKIAGMIGDSRAGKSFVLQAYARKFQPDVVGAGVAFPVLYLEARPDWDVLEMGKQLYLASGSFPPRLTTASLNTMTTRQVIESGVQLLIIDDAHFLYSSISTRRAAFFGLIKHLADQFTCNILLGGLKLLEEAAERDTQIKGRGGFPRARVKSFDPGTRAGREQYRLFLHGVDRRLPFAQLSGLGSPEYAVDFMEFSRGSVGNTMNVVIAAALDAMNEDAPRIMAHHLRRAAEERLTGDADGIYFHGEDDTDA